MVSIKRFISECPKIEDILKSHKLSDDGRNESILKWKVIKIKKTISDFQINLIIIEIEVIKGNLNYWIDTSTVRKRSLKDMILSRKFYVGNTFQWRDW